MNVKDFIRKLTSFYLLGHLAAMALVVVLVCLGVWFGLRAYTLHGQGIKVPDLKGMNFDKALLLLQDDDLLIAVSDSGYNKRMPANSVLAQNPSAGVYVKAGRTIYVTVNSPSSPTLTIPDIVDNSSYREATARLSAMGFRMMPPKRVSGEKDWVYGIESGGHRLATGDQVSIESPLTLVIGSGIFDEEDSTINYVEPVEDEFPVVVDVQESDE